MAVISFRAVFRVVALLAISALAFGAAAQPTSAVAPAASAPADAEPRFDILEFQVEDNTVLTVRAIESAVTPFLGPARSMNDVDSARAALEKAYQGAGFLTVFVDVPEQRVDDGLVRLRVTEGKVDRLKVVGSRYFSQGYIREKLPELAEGGVPNFNTLQAQLATVNRTEDRRVQTVLRPGATPGTVEIELKVDDKLPLRSSIELNNHHAANTEALRLIGTVRYDNLFQRDHGLAITAITAPQQPRQSKVLTATYTVPRDDGSAWTGYALLSDSQLEPLAATTVIGKGFTAGLRYTVPLPGPAELSHSVSFGVDYKDLRERVDANESLSTPVRYLPFSLTYNGYWAGGAGASTQANAVFTFAASRLLQRRVDCPGNVGPVDQFACKRQGADGGFSTLRVDLRHRSPLSVGGTLALRGAGQLATQPLISADQYIAGGADSVRGYFEGEAAGDMALFGSAEWQSPNGAEWLNARFGAEADSAARLNEAALLGFLDVARVDLMQPSAGQARRVGLIGSGVGLRVRAARSTLLEVDLAWPLRRTDSTPSRDPRLHVKLAVQF